MITTTTKETGETFDGIICVDCLMFHANRDTSGTSRCDTEDGETEFLADIGETLAGYNLTLGSLHDDDDDDDDDEERETIDFYRFDSGCDSCGSTLAGSGHRVTLWELA